MEREKGSLHDRLRDFGREPNPEILASLQSQLAERRGKKRPAWWLLAAAIVFVGGVSTTVFHALELEQNPHQTIAESTGKDVPLAGRNENSIPSSTSSSRTNHQSKEIKPTLAEEPEVSFTEKENPVRQKIESNQNLKRSAARIEKQSDKSELNIAAIPTRTGKNLTGLSSESVESESAQPNKEPVAGYSRTAKRNTVLSKSSRHLTGSQVVKKDRTKNLGTEQGETGSVTSVHYPILSKPQTEDPDSKSISAKSNQDQSESATEKNVVNTTITDVSVNQDAQTSKSGNSSNDLDSPKKDSIAKANPKDTALVAAATDSTKVPAGKRLSFSVLAGTRYSAVRYYAINQEKSEFRNQLTNENGAFPSRMSFEAGTRIDYKPGNQFIVYGDLDFGYAKEDLYLLATSAVAGQFDRTVSGNSLILNPKQKTQKEHISASIWYSSVLAGFGIQMMPQMPLIRVGAGVQFVLMSDVTRQLDGSTLSNQKMSGPAVVGFLRVSASKEIPFGTKGMLVVEPMVQYFLNPVYRMKTGTSILPLQTGVQVGWKW